jgi:enterobactin synthetase component D / holo-[acyl-carrier protein] synthase
MLESLLPSGVHAVEGPILFGGWDVTPEELARTTAYVPQRKAEFLTGRTYARRALRSLGMAAPTLDWNADRGPVWPEGAIGSITHTRDYCAAVAARADGPHAIRGIGVDVETPGRITEGIALKTFTEGERAALALLREESRRDRMCALFCAKEAFYKMQFPMTRAWVGFQDVEVELGEDGSLRVTLGKEIPGTWARSSVFSGRFALADGRAAAIVSDYQRDPLFHKS